MTDAIQTTPEQLETIKTVARECNEHQPNCKRAVSHPNVPLNESACYCYEQAHFMAGYVDACRALVPRIEAADQTIQRYAGDLYRTNGYVARMTTKLAEAAESLKTAGWYRQASEIEMLIESIDESIAYHEQVDEDDIVELPETEDLSGAAKIVVPEIE